MINTLVSQMQAGGNTAAVVASRTMGRMSTTTANQVRCMALVPRLTGVTEILMGDMNAEPLESCTRAR